MTKNDLYGHFKEECKEANMDLADIPSVETFRYVWKKCFLKLKIPRYNTLGACNRCEQLKLEKKAARGKPEYGNACAELSKHWTQVREERKFQTIRDQDAATFPHLTWTLTTDFMADLAIPWVSTRPKNWYVPYSITKFKV